MFQIKDWWVWWNCSLLLLGEPKRHWCTWSRSTSLFFVQLVLHFIIKMVQIFFTWFKNCWHAISQFLYLIFSNFIVTAIFLVVCDYCCFVIKMIIWFPVCYSTRSSVWNFSLQSFLLAWHLCCLLLCASVSHIWHFLLASKPGLRVFARAWPPGCGHISLI